MDKSIIIAILVLGLIINWMIIGREVRNSPQGAMGMGLLLIFGCVPWLVVILLGISKIVERFR